MTRKIDDYLEFLRQTYNDQAYRHAVACARVKSTSEDDKPDFEPSYDYTRKLISRACSDWCLSLFMVHVSLSDSVSGDNVSYFRAVYWGPRKDPLDDFFQVLHGDDIPHRLLAVGETPIDDSANFLCF